MALQQPHESAAHCGFAYGDVCPSPTLATIAHGIYSDRPLAPNVPRFLMATFSIASPGDTFLDTRSLGKGVVFINGHNLGRFWTGGPQNTLYVPGPWLKAGSNQIVVFDMLPNPHESVAGLDHPILDGPTSDKTTSKQQ